MQKLNVLISKKNPAFARTINVTIDKERFNLHSLSESSQTESKKGFEKRLKESVYNFLDNNKLGVYVQKYLLSIVLEKKFLKKLKKKLRSLESTYNSQNIDAVIIGSDRGIGEDLTLQLYAKTNRLPIILLSYAYSAEPEALIKSRKKLIYKAPNNKFGFQFYKPHIESGLRKMELLSKNPYIHGAGVTDYIIVDTLYERERLKRLGHNGKNLFALGSLSLDKVYNENIESSESRDYLLIALPQLYEHGLTDYETHIESIHELLSAAKGSKKSVLVSLHPKMSIARYRYLSRLYDCEISESPLEELMPKAENFISTYSSTVAWALINNLKPIIYDPIRLNYENFFPDIYMPIARNKDELISHIKSNRKLSDEDRAWIKRNLSPIDGRSFKRINKFLYKVVGQHG